MLDLEKVMRWHFTPIEQQISFRDCLLYALSLGYGRNPLDEVQLRFVCEEELKVVPSMASVVAHPAFWSRNPETGIDWVRIVHGQQSVVFHRTLPSQATIVGQMKVLGVEDKGAGKGALVYTQNQLTIKDSGELVATIVRSRSSVLGTSSIARPSAAARPAVTALSGSP